LNIKFEKRFEVNDSFTTTFSAGVKNLFNAYQDDFDTGPMRDSDYIYGPIAPRTIFVGLKFGKL
jgi:outer membrane receptor for ferrienterochelin and colicins